MKIWTLNNTNLKARKGLFGKNVKSYNLLTVASTNDDYITGV